MDARWKGWSGLAVASWLAVAPIVWAGDGGLAPHLTGGPIDLDTGETTNVGGISAAFNSVDDEYRIVWFDSRITGQNDVYAQRLSPTGMLLGDNVPIVTGTNSQTDTAVAHSPAANRYFITWKNQGGPPGSSGFNHAFGGLASATGGLITPAVDVSNGGLEATLVYNGIDNEFFLEARNFAGGGTAGIRGQRISAAGMPVGGGITIATEGAPAPAGQVAYNGAANQYLATWRDQVARDLKGRILNGDGSPATVPFQISPIFPTSGIAASVAFDPASDRYLVVFGTFSGGPVRGQFVTPAGTLQDPAFVIVEGVDNLSAFLAYEPVNGVYLVAWQNATLATVDVQLLSSAGDLLGDPLPVAASGAVGGPRVAASSIGGGFAVSWRDGTNSPVRHDVLAQLVGVGLACPADVNGDRVVDVLDLLAVLAAWGVCPGCPEDINGDGVVDVLDLLELLAAWGPCP